MIPQSSNTSNYVRIFLIVTVVCILWGKLSDQVVEIDPVEGDVARNVIDHAFVQKLYRIYSHLTTHNGLIFAVFHV